MDRLIYTDRKKSGKKKFNIAGKEIGMKIPDISLWVRIAVTGIMLGAGSFMTFITAFGIPYRTQGFFTGSPLGGLIKLWNDIACKLAEERGIFADQLMGASENGGLCLSIILIFLIAVSVLVVISRIKWLALIYPIWAVLPTLLWQLGGSVLSYAVLAFGILLFLADGQMKSSNYRSMAYVLALVLAAFVLMSVPAISRMADKPQSMRDHATEIHESIADRHYGTNVLSNGDLRKNRRGKAQGTALEISMPDPHPMYLRGFVGDVLEADGWKPLSNSVYYQNRNLDYWLTESGFNALGQLQQSSELAYKGGKKQLDTAYEQTRSVVEVKNTGADSRYAYIPYEIMLNSLYTADDKEKYQNWGNSFITAGWLNRLNEYKFTAAENLTGSWTEAAAKFYTNKATAGGQQVYEIAESNYNNYVYNNYLYIADEDMEILDYQIGDPGDQKRGHVEYNTAIRKVKQEIQNTFSYEENFNPYKKNKRVLANIMNRRVGYDAQLATAAVMMFRYYGIPARYVEGYIVTQEDVQDGAGTISVSRKNNHAWAEIYVDKIGFVPVEVCYEYAGRMPEADYSIGISNKTQKPTMDNTRDNSADPNDVPPMSNTAKEHKVPSKILLIVGIIAGLLIAAALVLLMLKLIRRLMAAIRRRALFRKGDPKTAACAIYKRMEDLKLEPEGEAVEIGNKAAYSEYLVTETERQKMLILLKKLRRNRRKYRMPAKFKKTEKKTEKKHRIEKKAKEEKKVKIEKRNKKDKKGRKKK